MIDKDYKAYNLTDLPEPVELVQWGPEVEGKDRDILNRDRAFLWSGMWPIPTVGSHVVINMNNLGPGTVTGYLVEHGWLGVCVKLDSPPEWHVKQTKGKPYAGTAMVFGAELDTDEKKAKRAKK